MDSLPLADSQHQLRYMNFGQSLPGRVGAVRTLTSKKPQLHILRSHRMVAWIKISQGAETPDEPCETSSRRGEHSQDPWGHADQVPPPMMAMRYFEASIESLCGVCSLMSLAGSLFCPHRSP